MFGFGVAWDRSCPAGSTMSGSVSNVRVVVLSTCDIRQEHDLVVSRATSISCQARTTCGEPIGAIQQDVQQALQSQDGCLGLCPSLPLGQTHATVMTTPYISIT